MVWSNKSKTQALGTQALTVLRYGIDYRAILETVIPGLYFFKWKSRQKKINRLMSIFKLIIYWTGKKINCIKGQN